MTPAAAPHEKFSFTSSVADDVWHPRADAKAYEWWYFDALSDDGREALVIIFLDNFIFSPRYNRSPARAKNSEQTQSGFPAVVFIYYKDGKPLYRAINEYTPAEFSADTEKPFCRIGNSFFSYKSVPYGSGYLLDIDVALRRNFRLRANLEWLSVESDFLPAKGVGDLFNSHNWNLVAPRSDVTGRIEILKSNGKSTETRHFRGTGYHDHNTDARHLAETVRDWQWGRAHFTDSTHVFYRYRENNETDSTSRIFIVKDGELKDYAARCEESNFRRNIFGLKYPETLRLTSDAGHKLTVRQNRTIDASFFYLRFLSEIDAENPDGSRHSAFSVTEHLAPKALKYRWLDRLIDMRIGKKGKGSFLP